MFGERLMIAFAHFRKELLAVEEVCFFRRIAHIDPHKNACQIMMTRIDSTARLKNEIFSSRKSDYSKVSPNKYTVPLGPIHLHRMSFRISSFTFTRSKRCKPACKPASKEPARWSINSEDRVCTHVETSETTSSLQNDSSISKSFHLVYSVLIQYFIVCSSQETLNRQSELLSHRHTEAPEPSGRFIHPTVDIYGIAPHI